MVRLDGLRTPSELSPNRSPVLAPTGAAGPGEPVPLAWRPHPVVITLADGGFPRVKHPPPPLEREARTAPLSPGSSGPSRESKGEDAHWNLRRAREKKIFLEV